MIDDKIREVVVDISQSDYSPEEIDSIISRLLSLGEWPQVRDSLLKILLFDNENLWPDAITLIYFFVNRGFEFDKTKTVALLYSCLEISDNLDSNLVWTISRNLMNLPYLSDWDAYNDESIVDEMERIGKSRRGN